MRPWSLLIAGAAISLGAAAQAQAPDIRDLLRQAPIVQPDGQLPSMHNLKEIPPAPGFESKTEEKTTESKSQPEPHVPATLESKLDEVLGTKDYAALAKAIAQAPPMERTTWLANRLMYGKTVFLGYALLRDMWGLAQLKDSAVEREAGTAVGLMALYVLQVHILDGAMCEDVSAPGHRLMQYMIAFQPVFENLKSKSVEEKQKLILLARIAEARSRPFRHGDDYLCRGGMAEFKASVEHLGPKMTIGELAAKYGEKSKSGLGTDVKLPPPAKKYEPKFLPPEKYEPEQAKLRLKMRETLRDLLK